MEMEELKNMWFLMDEKLKKQEILNNSIVKEIMKSKGSKSLNRLVFYEIFGFSVCLLLIPFIIYCIKTNSQLFITWYIVMYLCCIFCILYCLWGLLKMSSLFKVDFTKNIANNVYYISKYDIRMKYEKMVMWFVIPVLFSLAILFYIQKNVAIELFILMIVVFLLAGFISIWSYKKMYPKLISSVKESFEKLKELEEE